MRKTTGFLLAGVLAVALSGCGKAPAPAPTTTPAPATTAATTAAPAADAATTAAPATDAATTPAPTTAAPTAQAENFTPVKLRVAYMPNMGSASLVVTARDKGYFKDMGIDVDLVEFQGGPAEIAAMASGDIEIAQIGHGAHALCVEGEAVIFEIDATSLADAVIGNKSKGVNTIADLKGKKVAATSGTSAEIILDLALQSAGLSKKDVEIVEMDANGIVTAMVSGNVDACATWSPGTATIMKALGDKAVMLADNNDYLDKATFPSSFITTHKYADANRGVLVRFARALQNAADYRAAHIDEVAKLVAKQCETDPSVMLGTVGEGNWLTSDFIGKGLADGTIKKFYENQQQIFIDSGRIKNKVDVDKYVLFDIMKEAYDDNHKK